MKKLLFISLAILLIAGVAGAVSMPQSEYAEEGPFVWTVPVFNNSGGTMDVGDVAVWQFSSSTGDNDNYVTTTTTADTLLVAGVIYPNDILNQDSGTMAIRGVVSIDVIANGTIGTTNTGFLLCTSGTAGAAQRCSDPATDAEAFGFATSTFDGSNVTGYIFGR